MLFYVETSPAMFLKGERDEWDYGDYDGRKGSFYVVFDGSGTVVRKSCGNKFRIGNNGTFSQTNNKENSDSHFVVVSRAAYILFPFSD